jgi:hypothetical protein
VKRDVMGCRATRSSSSAWMALIELCALPVRVNLTGPDCTLSRGGGVMPNESRHRVAVLISLVLSLYISLVICVIVRKVGVLNNVHDHRVLHRIAQVVSGSYIDMCTPPAEWATHVSLSDACPKLGEHLLVRSADIDGVVTARIGPPEGTSYRLWSETGSVRNCTVWKTGVLFSYVYQFPNSLRRGMEMFEVTSCEPVN